MYVEDLRDSENIQRPHVEIYYLDSSQLSQIWELQIKIPLPHLSHLYVLLNDSN